MIVLLAAALPLVVAFYLAVLATIVIRWDREASSGSRVGQLLVTWLLPFVGASLVLYVAQDQSPDLLARLPIPWPFRGMLRNPPPVLNKDADAQDSIADADFGRGWHDVGNHTGSGH
jgi:hypothetical protein